MTEFYQKAQEFAQRVIAPRADEIDQTDEFPKDIFDKLAEEGYMGLIVPTEYGGLGKGYLEHAEVVMALSEVSGTVGICYFQHNTTIFEVMRVGTDELKNEVFNGVVKDHKICALACSEINTGCHFYSCETTAERLENGKTKINGVKSMVTMATYASWYCIDCQAVGTEGISQWLIPADLDGIPSARRIGMAWACMATSAAPWSWTTSKSPSTTAMATKAKASSRFSMSWRRRSSWAWPPSTPASSPAC